MVARQPAAAADEIAGTVDLDNQGEAYRPRRGLIPRTAEFEFTLERAAFLVRLSEVAYTDPAGSAAEEERFRRNCHDAGLNSPGYFIDNKSTGTELYVFNTPYAIVLTFRGVESLTEWREDRHQGVR